MYVANMIARYLGLGNKKTTLKGLFHSRNGESGGIRTHDTKLKRLVL